MALLGFGKKKKHFGEDDVHHPEKAHHEEGGHDESNWLVAYADMMTLLCGFFVMMFSMASLEKPKFKKVAMEISQHFGGKAQAESQNEELRNFVTQLVTDAGIDKDTLIIEDADGVAIVFQSTVFFDSSSADIRSESQQIVSKLVDGIKGFQIEGRRLFKIVVEGHTDARPVIGGNYPSNWELSGSRASRVVRMFLEKGFAPERLLAIGYADTRPFLPSRSPSGEWDETALSKNRRVVIRVLDANQSTIPWDGVTSVNSKH